jgi:hypothetical protein
MNFHNGLAMSTIWFSGTYSSNHNSMVDISLPMEASDVEIMFIGEKEIPERLAAEIREVIGEKNSSGDPEGPYGHVTVEEWIEVVNLLNDYKE